MTTTPRNEQEIIITYDRELEEWHYYSDCPPLNRKWRDLVDAKRIKVEPTGIISLLEGTIIGNVGIRHKRTLTDEQRTQMAERLRQARQK